jgi:hypothetical protein
MMLWLSVAWSWLKRNWHWLIAPVGVALWLLGRLGSKTPVVVTSGQLAGQALTEAKAMQQAAAERAAVDNVHAAALQRLDEGYAVQIKGVGQAAQLAAKEVDDDPEAVNALLHGVSKDIRGEPKT